MEALDKLKAICDAATPGPWNIQSNSAFGLSTEDAAFCTAASRALPALIELVEALERERECSQTVSACAKEAILRPSEENKEAHKAAYCVYKATVAAVESAKAKLENIVCPTA